MIGRTSDGQGAAALYLDLLERVLTGILMEDAPLTAAHPHLGGTFKPKAREAGLDWPSQAFTMIGLKRLRNFRTLIEKVLSDRVPGDFIETGVWRGGACIMARAVLAAHDIGDRKVYVADSFEGLPPPNDGAFPADAGSNLHTYKDLAVSQETVMNNFRKFGLLDEQVVFLKGWFKDTMPTVPAQSFAILRLDGDMYESTIDPLRFLYDRLSPGGYVIVDDYFLDPCKAAVHDFLDERRIKVHIHRIDGLGIYFQKAAT